MDPCIAYIHLHHFYALLEAKYRPNLSQVPFVVTQGEKIMDVSPQAANLNIHVAMGLRQARLICPELEIIKMEVDPEPFLEKFKDICATLTPLVEPSGDLGVFLDLSGLGEPLAIVKKVASKLRWQLAFPWCMGVATSKLVAKIACQELLNAKPNKAQHNYLMIQPLREKAFLSSLGVNRLWPWPDKIHQQLQNLGIYTIGQLAQVPRLQLQAQLGEVGDALLNGAQGIDPTPVEGLYPPQTVQGYFQLPPDAKGCGDLSTLNRHLIPALQSATASLRAKDQICTRLRLFVQYDGAPKKQFDKNLKEGLQAEDQLLELIQELLTKAPWPAPITGIRLMLMGLKPRGLHQAIFAPQILGIQPSAKLRQTLAILQTKFGNETIFLAKNMSIPRRERMLLLLTEYQ